MSKNRHQFNDTPLSKNFKQIYEPVYYNKFVTLLVNFRAVSVNCPHL
jgi:hypothetical protein